MYFWSLSKIKSLKKQTVSILLLGAFLLSPIFSAASFNQSTAQDYLLNHPNSPWATMALTVLGQTNIPADHLKNITASSAIEYAAPILAITALNKDPRTFGSKNYVAALEEFYSQGQLGDPQTLNDDIFGLLALVSSGQNQNSEIVVGIKDFISNHQNTDGGWGFMLNSSSDTNMTAAAIAALIASGVSGSDTKIQNAVTFLKQAQNNDGGFPYDPKSSYGTDSDSSSTAWVIWALNALHIDPTSWSKSDGNPVTFLESNQTAQGYFKYQSSSQEDTFSAVTTAYAVIALSGKTLPLSVFSPSQTILNFPFRIEGSNETICEGQTAGPTALDIVKNASLACGFTYNITQTAYGPYLNKINDDQAFGMTGWLYLVNNTSPSVGAADYVLKPGDDVLWYFGDFGWKPSRLTLSNSEINSGQNAQALVEFYEDGNWQTLSGATVYFGTNNVLTDSAGQANLSAPDGYYKVYAQKPGYIKSNSLLLKVGQPHSASVSLQADFVGQVQGTTTPDQSIAFMVEPDNLDFGQISSGSSQTKTLVIKNTGSMNLQIESIVSGDSVFKDNLFLNDLMWRKFKTFVTAGQNQDTKVSLNIPQTYSATFGPKTASLTFWAAAE